MPDSSSDKHNATDFEIENAVLLKYHGNARFVQVPEQVKEIGEFAFRSSIEKYTVVLPEGLEIIDNYAFRDSGLCQIDLPKSLRRLGKGCFWNTELEKIEIPEGVTELPFATFHGANYLKQVTLPSSLRIIDEAAFMSCSALKEILVPEGVLRLGKSAFYHCNSLESVVLADSLKSIGEGCFIKCSKMKSIKIPARVKLLREETFLDCLALEHIQLPDDVKLGKDVFKGCLKLKTKEEFDIISTELIRYNGNSEHVIVPAHVRTISAQAFLDCDCVKSIELPAGLKQIADAAFENCTSLSFITLPGLTHMGMDVFSGCSSLRSVTFSEGLQELGNGCFYGCDELIEISLPASLHGWNWRTFFDLPKLKRLICVPGSPPCQISFMLGIEGVDKVGQPLKMPEIDQSGWKFQKEGNYVILLGRKDKNTGIYPQGYTDGYDGWEYDSKYTGYSLFLPQTINKLPVTRIAKDAFKENFLAVHIPEGVEVVEAKAFHDPGYVHLPLSLEKISDDITDHYLSINDKMRVKKMIMGNQEKEEVPYVEDEYVGTGNKYITEAQKNHWAKFDAMSFGERCQALRHYLRMENSSVGFGWEYPMIYLDNESRRFRVSDIGDSVSDFVETVENLEHGDVVHFGWSDEPGYYGWYMERRGNLVYVEFPEIKGGVFMTYSFFLTKVKEMS